MATPGVKLTSDKGAKAMTVQDSRQEPQQQSQAQPREQQGTSTADIVVKLISALLFDFVSIEYLRTHLFPADASTGAITGTIHDACCETIKKMEKDGNTSPSVTDVLSEFSATWFFLPRVTATKSYTATQFRAYYMLSRTLRLALSVHPVEDDGELINGWLSLPSMCATCNTYNADTLYGYYDDADEQSNNTTSRVADVPKTSGFDVTVNSAGRAVLTIGETVRRQREDVTVPMKPLFDVSASFTMFKSQVDAFNSHIDAIIRDETQKTLQVDQLLGRKMRALFKFLMFGDGRTMPSLTLNDKVFVWCELTKQKLRHHDAQMGSKSEQFVEVSGKTDEDVLDRIMETFFDVGESKQFSSRRHPVEECFLGFYVLAESRAPLLCELLHLAIFARRVCPSSSSFYFSSSLRLKLHADLSLYFKTDDGNWGTESEARLRYMRYCMPVVTVYDEDKDKGLVVQLGDQAMEQHIDQNMDDEEKSVFLLQR